MNTRLLCCLGAALLCTALASTARAAGPELTPEELAELFPGIEAANVVDSPLPGVYEVTVGASVAYVSKDGRYLLRGELIDLETEVNLTAQRQNTARASVLDQLDEAQMVIFSPEEPVHTITVFTDIDCGYCRRMHREMDELNALGIRVRYLFYPRGGPGSEAWSKANNVWCAPDRLDAMTAAKNGEQVPARNCGTTPVREHYDLGGRVGLQGTPAIYTEAGEMVGGYLPPEALLARLRASAARDR
jgi:thiol:disulfide interchange protein DsbC